MKRDDPHPHVQQIKFARSDDHAKTTTLYGELRYVCVHEGCSTILAHANRTKYCSIHVKHAVIAERDSFLESLLRYRKKKREERAAAKLLDQTKVDE